MGAWGPGLYDDDDAADLRDAFKLLGKLPFDGDRILDIVLETWPGSVGLDADGGPAFWLVVADQFEKHGIESRKVFETALDVIASGADLRDMRARDMSEKDVAKREKMLKELEARLVSPRAARVRPASQKPPALVVEEGEVFAFPAMGVRAFNPWYRDWAADHFVPDGWGAMLVVQRGRVFDWLPYCVIASLSVPRDAKPTLEDCTRAGVIHVMACVPRAQHLKKQGMQSIGVLTLDREACAQLAAQADHPDPRFAVMAGWSFYAQAWNGSREELTTVAELLAKH